MKINLLLAGTLLSLSLFSQNTANTADSSNTKTVTDVDGNTYKTVRIGDQVWMTENLRTTKYSDGTAIPNVTDDNQWKALSTAAWCHYDNDSSQHEVTYGKLYNGYAVVTGKLCPTDWHIPTSAEWTVLTDYLVADGHSGAKGKALKSTSGWGSGGNGTDDYGWLGLPGGWRENDSDNFDYIGENGVWWSSSKSSANESWNYALTIDSHDVYKESSSLEYGYSARCLRD
jgi:uncharacterized protein (TIGR02145 family)